MYLEEMKEQEQNGTDEKGNKSDQNEDSASKSSAQPQEKAMTENQTKIFNSKQETSPNQHGSSIPTSMASSSSVGGNIRNSGGFSLIGSSELEGITQGSPKKQRSFEMLQSPSSIQSMSMDHHHHHQKANEVNNEQVSMRANREGYPIIGGTPTNFTASFGQYPIEDLGRFDTEQFTPRFSGNSTVSLTLGLPHCENNLSLSGTHQSFIPNQNVPMGRRVDIGEANDFGAMNTSGSHSAAAFENIDIQNRKRFAAQLLPDFVA